MTAAAAGGCSGCGGLGRGRRRGRRRSAAKPIAGGGYFGCVLDIVMGRIRIMSSSPGDGEEGKDDGEPHVSYSYSSDATGIRLGSFGSSGVTYADFLGKSFQFNE